MTIPGPPYQGGYSHTWGQSRPPLEDPAADAIASARHHLGIDRQPAPPPRLTAQERTEAEEAAKQDRYCRYCAGIHAMPSTTACPRLAGGKIDGDGKIVEFTFWPGTAWAEGRVVFAEDALEEGSEEEAGDGER